ncbi:transferrin-binding protein-like solute binding protein [Paracoccus pantotrophus]|uniref:transferrin-binding protein-like solute binding protein n=1 Tax=Paracoccus pantotrophus TaxID=82367 RepID=UPI0035B1FE6D
MQMAKIFSGVLVTSITLALAGCGGGSGSGSAGAPGGGSGGGGGGGGGGGTADGQTFLDHDGPMMEMVERTESLAQTGTGAMPTTGSATYDGYAFVEMNMTGGSVDVGDPGYEAAIGKIALNANFANSSVSGQIHEVGVEDGPTLTGSLPITGGSISGSGMSGRAAGTLGGGGRGDIGLDLVLDGTFRGSNAEVVRGNITGTVEYDGATGTVFGDSGFVAER